VQNGDENFFVFSLSPTYAIFRTARWSMYSSGGVGASWTQVRFFQPKNTCTEDYGCYAQVASQTSGQPALNAGAGVTYRFHRNGGFELFVEARYLEMFTPQRTFPGFNSAGTALFLPQIGLRVR